jgi:ADP-ribose pyrophosphatase YjhB (NUDIX family)
MADKNPLTHKEFWYIYKKVPRLTVEVIVRSDNGIFLKLRDVEPCKGTWNIPGGTVRFGEKLTDAVSRVAKSKLGIKVKRTKLLGYIEYPSHYTKGLDSPVGIAFEVTNYDGQLRPNSEANGYGWFKKLPSPMHQEQKDFLKQYL